jgi:hypothetical protein
MLHLSYPGNSFGHGEIGEGNFRITFCFKGCEVALRWIECQREDRMKAKSAEDRVMWRMEANALHTSTLTQSGTPVPSPIVDPNDFLEPTKNAVTYGSATGPRSLPDALRFFFVAPWALSSPGTPL